MTAEQLTHELPRPARRPMPGPAPLAPATTRLGGTAVDPRLIVEPLDVAATVAADVLHFAARLTDPDGAPLGGATVLFTISVAARTTVKCAAVTDDSGVARAASTLPAGLFERQPLEFRVGFAGAPPFYWPVSVAGTFA